jgi:hypothetical protein
MGGMKVWNQTLEKPPVTQVAPANGPVTDTELESMFARLKGAATVHQEVKELKDVLSRRTGELAAANSRIQELEGRLRNVANALGEAPAKVERREGDQNQERIPSSS